MYKTCCVGHITLDKVVTTRSTLYMAGGTAFYFSSALQNLDAGYVLVTSLAKSEMHYADDLCAQHIEVKAFPSTHTVYFENIYAENQDHRTQNVLQQADPFTIEQLKTVDAELYHLGPLLANDIPFELVKFLASKGKVSLDAQGYLRKVENQKVHPVDWPEKQKTLQFVHTLKVDEAEMAVLTGHKDVTTGAKMLTGWGVKEVVITNGSMGSVIYSAGIFYDVPAYTPENVIDATGCGDTYMAGYLYKRSKGAGIQASGQFAAAMASLKMESPGPFTGTEQQIIDRIAKT